MGYAGGTTPQPIYYAIGNHSETVQIDYDPSVISYEELLDEFLAAHDPAAVPISQQYASIIHYRDEAQRLAAEKALADYAARTGQTPRTVVVPLGPFYWAEDYHQKYQLRQIRTVEAEFEAIYPDYHDLTNSTAAMRINAYAGGYLPAEDLADEAPGLGLSEAALDDLADSIGAWYR